MSPADPVPSRRQTRPRAPRERAVSGNRTVPRRQEGGPGSGAPRSPPNDRRSNGPDARTAGARVRRCSSGCWSPAWCCALVLAGIGYFAYRNTTIPDANKAFEAQSTLRLLLRRQGQDRPVRRAEPRVDPAGRHPAVDAGRRHRRRGPHLLQQQRHRPEGHPPRGLLQRARATPPRARRRSPSSTSRSSTSARSARSRRKVKEAFLSLKVQQEKSKADDPRGLPEHHLLRPWRLRRPGRRQRLLRQARQGAHRPRVGDARGGAELARTTSAPTAAPRAATR